MSRGAVCGIGSSPGRNRWTAPFRFGYNRSCEAHVTARPVCPAGRFSTKEELSLEKNKAAILPLLAYITVAVVWGSTYFAIRVGVRDLPPFFFAGVRHLIAGSALALVSLITRQAFPRTLRAWGSQSLVGVLLLACGNGLVVWGEQWVDSGVAALLVATAPLFVAGLGSLLPGGRVHLRGWLGLLIGLAGVALLVGPGAPQNGRWLAGALGILLASFLWAFGSVFSQRMPKEGGLLPGLSIQMLAGGLVLSLVAAFAGQFRGIHPTAAGLGAMAYLVLCGSILAYSAYFYLLQHWPAAKASTYAYINPAVAVVLGAALLGEALTVRMVFAVPLILGGVLLVQLGGRKGREGKDGVAPGSRRREELRS